MALVILSFLAVAIYGVGVHSDYHVVHENQYRITLVSVVLMVCGSLLISSRTWKIIYIIAIIALALLLRWEYAPYQIFLIY